MTLEAYACMGSGLSPHLCCNPVIGVRQPDECWPREMTQADLRMHIPTISGSISMHPGHLNQHDGWQGERCWWLGGRLGGLAGGWAGQNCYRNPTHQNVGVTIADLIKFSSTGDYLYTLDSNDDWMVHVPVSAAP